MSDTFKNGDNVVFSTGGRGNREVSGTITGKTPDGKFFNTKDAEGKERKIRPGAIRKAA